MELNKAGFTLVPDNESDLKSGKISVNTPIAKGC
jgi:transcription elongation factor GreA